MNTTNASDETVLKLPAKLIVFVTLQQIVFVMACIGNGIVILIFVKYLKLKTNTNKFIVSLALADFLTGISSGMQILYFIYPKLSMEMVSCFLRYQIVGYTTLVSQFTVTFTTLDRYIAICYPHQYASRMIEKTAICLCVSPWVLVFLFCLGTFCGWHEWNPGTPCAYQLLFPRAFYLITALIMYSFSVASLLMYSSILRTAFKYYKKARRIGVESVNTFDQLQTTKAKTTEKDMRSAKVMGIVATAFTVCWLPYMSFPFRTGIGLGITSAFSSEIANWLVFFGMLNSVVNPFVYGWQRRDFRSRIGKMLSCKKSGHNLFRTGQLQERIQY